MASQQMDAIFSAEEMQRLETAMKDPMFRKLFVEYANEISQPGTREEYEKMFQEIEKSSGNGVNRKNSNAKQQILLPEGEMCIKLAANPTIFINICTASILETPTVEYTARGQNWKIPYTLSVPRSLVDSHGQAAKSFDFTVQKQFWVKNHSNPEMLALIVDVAIEALEKVEQRRLTDAPQIRLQNVKYKGGKPPAQTYISSSPIEETKAKGKGNELSTSKNNPKSTDKHHEMKEDDITLTNPTLQQLRNKLMSEEKTANSSAKSSSTSKPLSPIPTYTLTESGQFDSSAFFGPRQNSRMPNCMTTLNSTQLASLFPSRSKELVIRISLPLLSSSAKTKLDMTVNTLTFDAPQYRTLTINLPYPVDDVNGKASFSNKTHVLTVSLPIAPPTEAEITRAMDEHRQFQDLRDNLTSQQDADASNKENTDVNKITEDEEKNVIHADKPHLYQRRSSLKRDLKEMDYAELATRAQRHVHFDLSSEDLVHSAPSKPKGKGLGVTETWTGVGINPQNKLAVHSNSSSSIHPRISPQSSPRLSHSPHRRPITAEWPPYTYSQSEVSVVLVFKVKNIESESCKLEMQDQSVSLSFTTSSPLHHYSVTLPLAKPIIPATSQHQVGPKNLILTLMKADRGVTWTHLLDPSLEPTISPSVSPLGSPMLSAASSNTNSIPVLSKSCPTEIPLESASSSPSAFLSDSLSSRGIATAEQASALPSEVPPPTTVLSGESQRKSYLFELD